MGNIRPATMQAPLHDNRRNLRLLASVALVLASALPAYAQAEGWVIDGQATGPVTNSGAPDFLSIINGSVINGDVTNTVTGEIGPALLVQPGIEITDSDIKGALRNAGHVTSGTVAIDLSNAMLDGGLVNSGSIDSGAHGVSVRGTGGSFSSTTFAGGIVNSGSINSGEEGVSFLGSGYTTFAGGIVNSGSLNSGEWGVVFWGGRAGDFSGGIVNSGSIDAEFGGISAGATFGLDFGGGIVNSGSLNAGSEGISLIGAEAFDSGIVNSGSLNAGSAGISLNANAFDGGIVNSGSIDAGESGIDVRAVDTFGGGIVNSGSIAAGGFGIVIGGVDTFGGGIVNSGSIDARNSGIFLGQIETFNGDIENSGSIVSASGSGIRVSGDDFSGAVTNSGRIEAAVHGLTIDAPVRGGIWNSGTIKGGQSAINVEDGLGAPTVINLTGGAVYGDVLLSGTESDTVNISGGRMDGTIDGTKGPRDDVVNFLMDGNTVVFGGGILGIGRVFVDPGTLILNGSITETGMLEVDADTRLVVAETAQVATEMYAQNPDATLGFIIGADGSHGRLHADKVNLAGDLQILFDAGPLYPDRRTFSNLVSWTTRDGTFNLIAPESLFVAFRQHYAASTLSVVQERIPFNAYGQTSNQSAVGTGLERGYRYPAPNAEAVAFYAPLFDLASTADYLQLLDAVSGSTHANALQATINTSQVVSQAVQQRLDRVTGAMTVATAAERSLWAQALGVWGDADGDRNAAGFDQTTNGVAFGLDYQLSEETLVGVLGAYLADEVDFKGGRSKTDIDTWQIGAYAQHDTATWYANAILTYGWNDYASNRRIADDRESGYAAAGYDGTAFALSGEAGYKYPVAGGITLKPLLGLGYVNVDTNGFTERGDSRYNLRVARGSAASFSSNLGVRASLHHETGNGTLITGEARLSWQHQFLDDHQTVEAAFATVPNSGFEVRGSQFGRDAAVAELGVKVQIADQGELFLDWHGQFGGDYMANSLFAGARFDW